MAEKNTALMRIAYVTDEEIIYILDKDDKCELWSIPLVNQNNKEYVQTQKIFFLDNLNLQQHMGTLYMIDRETKLKQSMKLNVLNFAVLGRKIYYMTYNGRDGGYFFRCYDRDTMKTEDILSQKKNKLEMVWEVTEDSVYYQTEKNKLICYDMENKKEIQSMKYTPPGWPYRVYSCGSRFLVQAEGKVDYVSFEDGEVRRIISEDGLSENNVVGYRNKAYAAINMYCIGKNYGRENIETNNTGIWEIDMDTLEKKVIDMNRYDSLYLLYGKLYDEKFLEISVLP